eukprot:GFYU01006609.1.p1 GENE.GFYU01006609.1~~GFYU01006609.1.p1  ORF type:complete len:120 (-),score=46.28 GFYU01006609.1:356-715(-)
MGCGGSKPANKDKEAAGAPGGSKTDAPKRQNSDEMAATKIQAQFRGNQTRKEMEEKKGAKGEKGSEPAAAEKKEGLSEEEAATKIQAQVRGNQVRSASQQKLVDAEGEAPAAAAEGEAA